MLSFLGLKDRGSLTVESSRENNVEVIIIRQHTTKNSGYHTDSVACGHIARGAWSAVT